jgi:lysophospholipase L1-like esterase
VQIAVAAMLVAAMTGCDAGLLLSAPWIRDADNDDVVVFGDSIFALSGEIQANLHAYAGETFRNYTTSGAELTADFIAPSVAEQYARAMADNPDSSIILLDGGGNDILIPAIALDPYDCLTQWWEWGRLSSRCKSFIDDIYVDGVDLLNQMHAGGATDVILLGYYYTKNGLILADDLEEAIDYGDHILALACANSVANCTFIDPRSTIRNRDITIDGVHPNSTGSRKLADLIWPVLQSKL